MKFPTSLLTLLAVLPSAILGREDPAHKNDICYYAIVDFGCDLISIVYDNTPFDECSPYYNDKCQIVFKEGIEQFPECKNLSSREAAEMLVGEELKKAASGCGPKGEDLGVIGSRCGPEFGSCGGNLCCSKYGYCGITKEHCGDGCRQGYGNCMTHEGEIPITNVPERCGPLFGRCAEEDECCSQYGYCGRTEEHCDAQCQPDYGYCPFAPPPSSSTNPPSTKTGSISTVDGRCGEQFGGACEDEEECCSQYGYCGTSDAHCGAGCQSEFGICKNTPPSTAPKPSATTTRKNVPTATVSGRCGKQFGGACEGEDECCSKYNYCGTSDAHCGAGCQSEFGICKNTSSVAPKPSATTRKNVPTSTVDGRCGKQFGGACADPTLCCSQYGYCSDSDEHCGAGCQSEFGVCKTVASSPKVSTTTVVKKVTTTVAKKPIATVVGRCGKQFGGACADATLCCSRYNYCGSSANHCGTGCQSEFGVCKKVSPATTVAKKTPTTTKKAIATVTDRCGKQFGGACADATLCCSRYNYCGSTANHCGTGCQPQYGICH